MLHSQEKQQESKREFDNFPFMNIWDNIKSWLVCTTIILLIFIVVSLFDVVLAVLNPRFYSNALFITTFGVGGIFASTLGYLQSIPLATEKNEFDRWSLIMVLIIAGLLFFFPLAKMEGGEYAAAFKAYGATMALSSFLFAKGKID